MPKPVTINAATSETLVLVETATPSNYDEVGDVIGYEFQLTELRHSRVVKANHPVDISLRLLLHKADSTEKKTSND